MGRFCESVLALAGRLGLLLTLHAGLLVMLSLTDFLLDTSFTYELGLISRLLGIVRRQFTLEGHNAELWDETARRFEHVVPLDLELLPADSMLREFYGSAVK